MVDLFGFSRRMSDDELRNALMRSDKLITKNNPLGFAEPLYAARALAAAKPDQKKKYPIIDKFIFISHIANQPWYDPDIPINKIIPNMSLNSSTPSSKITPTLISTPNVSLN